MHDHSCGCGHDHSHSHDEKEKKGLFSLENIIFAIGIIAFILSLVFRSDNFYIELFKFIACYIIIGYQIIINCFKSIIRGQIFDENLLMLLASVGAFVLGDYFEGVAVVIFFTVGERFQDFAVGKSVDKIKKSLDFLPKTCTLESGNTIITSDIKIGDRLRVKSGERIPVDGKLISEQGYFNTSMLSGESLPTQAICGEQVLSGYIAVDTCVIEATKLLQDSTASKIIDLVSDATKNKSKSENLITKFAKIYTPCVMIAAILIAIFLPIITGAPFLTHLKTALTFLVVACPCALVISIPLCFFYGIGESSKIGALVKGGNYLSTLSNIDTIIFDKTGTLVEDKFKVSNIVSTSSMTKDELYDLICQVEFYSNHPLAKSVTANQEQKHIGLENIREVAGLGVYATQNKKNIFVGKSDQVKSDSSVIALTIDQNLMGYIELTSVVFSKTKQTIENLKRMGIKNFYMLSGDKQTVCEKLAKQLGIENVFAEKSPKEKLLIVEQICEKNKGKTAYVGDGINDVLAISRADIGISTSTLQDATTVASDIVLTRGGISNLDKAIKVSTRTKKKVVINIVFSLAIKALVMTLAFIFPLPLFVAILADVGAALVTIIISLF